ncbi:MAG: response regulator, partial [Haliea sp.]
MKDMSILNPEGTSRGVRVLLVDDQRMVGEAVRRMVQGEEGIEFKYCQNPEEAVAVAEEFRPTVILQDLVMPGIDGLSLVEIYKTNDILKHVPAIVLSSQEDPVIKAESFARGANDYLVKLPDRIELVARIRHHSEGYIHLLERNAAFHALAESQRILAAELA